MAEEPRALSRRDRRAASEGTPDDAPPATISQAPEIRAGFAFTTEIPVGQLAASSFSDVPGFATGGTPVVTPPPPPPPPPAPAAPAAPMAPVVNAAPMGARDRGVAEQRDAAGGEAPGATGGVSRRDRRRLERLENPMETWTQDEVVQTTGQVPTVSAPGDAAPAIDGIVPAGPAGAPEAGPMAITPVPDGGVPPALQHLFPPGPVQVPTAPPGGPPVGGMPPPRPAAPSRPAPPPGPSIDEHGRLVAPGGAAPLVVPGLADGAPTAGVPGGPLMAPPPGTSPQDPGQQGAPAGPQFAPQTAAFEALVAGGPLGSQKPPTVPDGAMQGMPVPPVPMPGVSMPGVPVPGAPVPTVQQGPFAPPGAGIPGMPPGVVFPPGGGQGVIVPGTGTLRTTGTLRAVPGTGAIPRPVVEVHPAGGVHHFGWVQLSLLAAAAFALGVVVWNVASRGS